MEKFDPKSKVTKMQGKDYLEVKWRIVWFRDEHPKGGILTEVINDDLVKATILDGEGKVLATGHGSSKKMGIAKSRPYEGAETAAIGRALAHAGYGTQFTDEIEGEHLAASPVERGNGTKPEMTEPEKKKAVIAKMDDLTKRAQKVNVKVLPLDGAWDSAQMKEHYLQQYKFVADAEDQAKAGQ